MSKYALIAALVAALGMSTALGLSWRKNAALEVELENTKLELKSLAVRAGKLRLEKDSDRKIDEIDDLTTVPDPIWLRP